MRKGKPSQTAMMVAWWRAVGDLGLSSVPNFSDPQARELLTGPFWHFWLRRAEAITKAPRSRLEAARPVIDVVILRVAFIDAVLAETRAQQVVILGAGLDTRSWRLPALRGARVFEVDHPSSQAYKREHAARLGPPLADLVYVPVDFTRDDLDQALAAAGHDPDIPTAWVWEGVIMYLDDAALRTTLRALRRRSASNSRLIANYHEPHSTSRAQSFHNLALRLWGEPQIGLRTHAVMKREIESAGFEELENADLEAQAKRVHAAPRQGDPPGVLSRILVARVA